jgi:hypothetical protein
MFLYQTVGVCERGRSVMYQCMFARDRCGLVLWQKWPSTRALLDMQEQRRDAMVSPFSASKGSISHDML